MESLKIEKMDLKKYSDDSVDLTSQSRSIINDSKLNGISRNTTKSFHFMNLASFSDLDELDNDIDDFQANLPSSNPVKRSTIYFTSQIKPIREFRNEAFYGQKFDKISFIKQPLAIDYFKLNCNNCLLTLVYLTTK
jgi:hypothetical protein